jgi:hypothetical protein
MFSQFHCTKKTYVFFRHFAIPKQKLMCFIFKDLFFVLSEQNCTKKTYLFFLHLILLKNSMLYYVLVNFIYVNFLKEKAMKKNVVILVFITFTVLLYIQSALAQFHNIEKTVFLSSNSLIFK